MITTTIAISAGLAIVLGLAVLFFPKLLRWAVGLWLITTGIIQIIQ